VRNILVFAVAIGLVVMLIGGCATPVVGGPSATGKSAEARVRDRAEARWSALIKGDTDKAYQFLSQTARETMPMAVYRSRVNAKAWLGATVDGVVCELEKCDVKITLKMEVLPNLPVAFPGVTETWILDQSEWWLVFKG
jgi:hypothetical protein